MAKDKAIILTFHKDELIIDSSLEPYLSPFSWHYTGTAPYRHGRKKHNEKSIVYLNREVCRLFNVLPSDLTSKCIIYKNKNKKDNRLNNLIICDKSEKFIYDKTLSFDKNLDINTKDNRVFFDKNQKAYRVCLQINNKNLKSRKTFATKEECLKAYWKYIKKYQLL
jgi:hypothetical protein